MFGLSTIQSTVTQVADAITAAIGIETEIVDANLCIISGTGRYRKKIGTYEEDGDLTAPYIYADILRTGREYICTDVKSDAMYHPMESELAEISCPIQIESQILGIIGLVAFTEAQRRKIIENSESLLNFLRRMSELIAGKYLESQSNSRLAVLLESMPEGLIAVDFSGKIFACNETGEKLLGRKRSSLIGINISSLFLSGEFSPQGLAEHGEKEIVYDDGNEKTRLMFTVTPMLDIGTLLLFRNYDDVASAARDLAHRQKTITFEDIAGVSPQIKEARQRALQVAESNSTVLIRGESGTGKELFARAIHAASRRRDEAFVAINCAAIPDTLLESELFGYEKGAFTGADKNGRPGKFEQADGGTLFLDEIGDMPLHMQVKLLRVLQNRTVERIGGLSSKRIDVRIISATNKDLEEMMKRQEFREDLYFRLNVIPLYIPPLRERREDVIEMLTRSLAKFNALMNKNIHGFSGEAMDVLKAYTWPGNVRELENIVEYAVTMETGDEIQLANIPDRIINAREGGISAASGGSLKEQTDLAQRRIITSVLKHTGTTRDGKRSAAKQLQISESSLYRKMRELGIGSI